MSARARDSEDIAAGAAGTFAGKPPAKSPENSAGYTSAESAVSPTADTGPARFDPADIDPADIEPHPLPQLGLHLEPEPAFAEQIFGPAIETARAFTQHLAERGEVLGLIGPQELPRLWSRHVANCVLLAPLITSGRVGDIGSGAGLPGLVLAIARPDVQFVLIEPMERRVDWLTSEVAELGLHNVEVVRARAEEARHLPVFDQVTARAVSALSKLIPLSAPLVRSGGELLFLKGAGIDRELEAASKAIKKARLWDVEVLTLGEEYGTETTRVFRAKVD